MAQVETQYPEQFYVDYPDRQPNRRTTLFRLILAIPHYFALFFLSIVAIVLVIFTWFVILLTGRNPRDIFNHVVGTLRWAVRGEAYAFILVTDHYSPFRLSP